MKTKLLQNMYTFGLKYTQTGNVYISRYYTCNSDSDSD